MDIWFNPRHKGRAVRVEFSDRKDPIDGFVLDFSNEWALMRIEWDYQLLGYSIVRRKNLKSIRMGEKERFTEAVVAHEVGSIDQPTDLPLQDLETILSHLTQRYGVFQIEERRNDMCWVGRLASVDGRKLRLDDLDPRARWKSPLKDSPKGKRREVNALLFRPWAIRVIEFDTPYINALKKVLALRERGKWDPKSKPRFV